MKREHHQTMNQNNDDWDDLLIINAFKKAVKSRSKNESNDSKVARKSDDNEAMIGEWIAVDKSENKRKRNDIRSHDDLYVEDDDNANNYNTYASSSAIADNDRDGNSDDDEGYAKEKDGEIYNNQNRNEETAKDNSNSIDGSPLPMNILPNMQGLPIPSLSQSDQSTDPLSQLLLSWYQAGYYTGRYQAMQEMAHQPQQQQQKDNKNQEERDNESQHKRRRRS